jgi:multicomponent Na+:H+ antiporter subunit E
VADGPVVPEPAPHTPRVGDRADSRLHCTVGGGLGVRVGLTPDTVVVELDEERGEMLLHVIDARDPDAVRAEQLHSYRRRQRRVFP